MGPSSYTFGYDGNGNATTRNGLSQSFASFDLPTLLRGTSYQSELYYGPRHQRWKQVASYSNGTETTHYVGGLIEKVSATSTGVTYWRHYVPTPGDATVVVSRNSNLTGSTHYVLTDHLGSTDTVLDANGNTVLRESFDTFGKRRGSNWNAGTAPDWATIGNLTRDGYTGHEMLDNVGLVHMKGRVYDPAVGRFLSVEPIIGDLEDSQTAPGPTSSRARRPARAVEPPIEGC
jgi:RHS repeat-associated protein